MKNACKRTITLLLALTLLLLAIPFSPVSAANENPFNKESYHFYVYDDLSGITDRQLTIPSSGSNADIYYYSGNGQTKYSYNGEKLRLTQASGNQLAMLTTGRHANKLSTRGTEGYGCYVSNHSGDTIVFEPLLVGDDFYQMRTSYTAYMVTSAGVASTVTSLPGIGGFNIPNNFEGYVAIPFSSLYPCWGNTTAFVPGTGYVNYFSVYVQATFSEGGGRYVDIDNMFVYGEGATANNEHYIKGGSIPADVFATSNPFDNITMQYYAWDTLSGVSDGIIPLPADGQENTYVKTISGDGTHVYRYQGEQLQITSATGWKHIQLKTNHSATAAQTANTEGFGFYVKNQTGKSITLQPIFRGGSNVFRLKASGAYRIVDMQGYSFEQATPDWGGLLAIPYNFEGYVIAPLNMVVKDGGGNFTPGTDTLDGFSVNVFANFTNDGNRYIGFDNMFLYGQNLNTVTPNVMQVLFPPAAPAGEPNGQTIAAPSSEGYNGNSLVGLDQFGRSFQTVTGEKQGKDVGMFFWLWMGQHDTATSLDMTELLSTESGRYELFNVNSTSVPVNSSIFWGKPILGYYNSSDEYVMRKQIEMLCLAGVDFITFDTTNAVLYESVYTKMFQLLDEYQQEGWDVPKITFFTHGRSTFTLKKIYYHVYKQNMYPNLWYYYQGKPMIIGYQDMMDDLDERQSDNDASYYPTQLPDEIINFFSFKKPQWPQETVNHPDGFSYVEWVYPQYIHTDTMNVAVASHHNALMSFTYYDRSYCWGRGYNFVTNQNVAADADKGTFYQAEWNQVFKEDPDIAFIGGWNEWTGGKMNVNGSIYFVDAFGREFSRDIEPMEGGYEDAFYLQTIANMRRFQNYTGKNYLEQGKTINIAGAVSQWDSGTRVYKAFGTANYGRDAYDASGNTRLVQDAPRNNIQEVRVVNDNSYLYFYIMCQDNITSYTGTNWMNLFIGTGEPAPGGWNGYDFVLNRSVNLQTGKSDILALSSNFSGTKVGEADIVVNGRLLMLKVSRSTLGLSTGTASGAEIYFKVADNVTNPESIQNYYKSGKSLPMGRLSYSYASVMPTALASAQNPVTDTSVGLNVYQTFSGFSNMELPLVSQGQYFWEAPNSSYFKMSTYKQQLRFTKAAAGNETSFMFIISNVNSNDLAGLQGVGFYVKNNTSNRVLLSPLYCGNHAFYMQKGKSAKLINLGGNMTIISDSNEFSDRSSFSIPAGFEGYITFATSDFICMWHGDTDFTPNNFSLGYFSLKLKAVGGVTEQTGETIAFDNLFFYGQGMASSQANLIRG